MVKKLILAWIFLLAGVPILAQQAPSVELVTASKEVAIGSSFFVDVMIRNGVAVVGADVGINVSGDCLHIINRESGNYIPTDGKTGGFSPFQELTDTSARLAANTLDRSIIGNGDGVFYRAELEATCETGIEKVEITTAHVILLANPDDTSSTEQISYRLNEGQLDVTGASLTFTDNVPIVELAPTIDVLPTHEAREEMEITDAMRAEAINDLDDNSTPVESETNPDTQFVIILAIALMVTGSLGILLLFVARNRHKKGSHG